MDKNNLGGWPWPLSTVHGKEFEETDIGNLANTYIHNSDKFIHGVYFLLQEGRIVYVGKTGNIRERLSQHSNGEKLWSQFFFIQCEEEEIDKLEAHYIAKFRPAYNINLIPRLE